MRFAVLLPFWGYALVFSAALLLAWLAYARVPVALAGSARALLTGLRAATLILIVAILLRPVVPVPPAAANNSLLTVMVDTSRSMRLTSTEGEGPSRLERAKAIVRDLQAALGKEYRLEVMTFGETVAPAEVEHMAATARRSDLSGAIAELADRQRSERLAGVVVLSDGGDTAAEERSVSRGLDAPVLTVGIGSPAGVPDREVVNLTAGEPLLPGASIDLSVSITSAGFGSEPIEMRVAANGRPVEVRRITPAEGAPIHQVFTVSPAPDVATVYSVEVPPMAGELSAENNKRSVLVPAQTGRRKILLVEGAPGFEHTFLKRALALDPGLDVDAVVRKGQNDDGRDTFYVQAARDRVAALAGGYPSTRSELFVYDAIIFGNIEADFFTRDQLELTSAFVAERGGGLLVLGARSFDRQGLSGTPLEEALPVDLTDRGGAVALASSQAQVAPNTPSLTRDGALHPATRLAVSMEENQQRWSHLPPLASVATIGGPRAGAQVLAVAVGAGEPQPLIAVQRYGQGRSMVFAGEASWRWRMLRPATDLSYETIWRQFARWITAGSQGPVTIAPMTPSLPGVGERIVVTVRDNEFAPIANAEVMVAVTAPNGETRQLAAALISPQDGRYAATARFDQPGVYRVDATATRSGTRVGVASRSVLSGGVDLEMAQPRLNEAVLRRLAADNGGQYVSVERAAELPLLLRRSTAEAGSAGMRDLWHNGWSLLAIVSLLGAEWVVRRRVGLA